MGLCIKNRNTKILPRFYIDSVYIDTTKIDCTFYIDTAEILRRLYIVIPKILHESPLLAGPPIPTSSKNTSKPNKTKQIKGTAPKGSKKPPVNQKNNKKKFSDTRGLMAGVAPSP